MPHQTVEALYHDGVVELREKPPVGIKKSRVLVTFLDAEKPNKNQKIDWDQVKKSKSSVDKWVGIIEVAAIGDWKAERRLRIEEKHQ